MHRPQVRTVSANITHAKKVPVINILAIKIPVSRVQAALAEMLIQVQQALAKQ